MNKTASIIIDTGFGDCGKGITVHNTCADNMWLKPLVIRTSGGPQAGHTVIYNGVKHIFSTYGSGTLLGCPTHLTQDVAVYLPAMISEYIALSEKIDESLINLSIHPHAPLITPYDVAWNRMLETARGSSAHGSCGLGVGATFKRHHESPVKIHACDLSFREILYRKLRAVKEYYTELLNAQSDAHRQKYESFCVSEEDVFEYALSIETNFKNLYTTSLIDISSHNLFVYESSQGLGLDAEGGIYPNVTYASTSSKNPIAHAKQHGISNIEITYVTRCYTTRHGAGWMPNEGVLVSLINDHEEINVHNKWQGDFRVSEFSVDHLVRNLLYDLPYSSTYAKDIIFTCLDQRPDFIIPSKEIRDTCKKHGIYISIIDCISSPHGRQPVLKEPEYD